MLKLLAGAAVGLWAAYRLLVHVPALPLWQVAIGLLATLCFAYVGVRWYLTSKPLDGIVHTEDAGKFLGDIPAIARHYKAAGTQVTFFDECYKKYGGLYQLCLGPKRFVIVNDMALIQDVAVRRTPSDFDRDDLTTKIFKPLVGDGQLAMRSTDQFKAHRKAIAPAIGSAYLSASHDTVAKEALALVKLWQAKRERFGDAPFSVKEDFFSSLTDTLARIVFGAAVGCVQSITDLCQDPAAMIKPGALGEFGDLDAPVPAFYADSHYMNESLGNALIAPVPRLHMAIESLKPRWRRAQADVWAFMRQRLAETRQASALDKAEHEISSIIELLVAKERKGTLGMTDKEVLAECYILQNGGSDTSATTLSWGIKFLARHPDLQRELHQHLVERLPSLEERLPHHAELASDRVPLLDAFAYEVIRLGRATTGGARVAVRDTQIAGKFVPAGTMILLSSSASIHQRAEVSENTAEARKERLCGYWTDEDPSRFDPHRWLAEDGSFDPRAGPLMSFSMGSRGCWGRSIAIHQIKIYLAIISLSFFLDAVPPALDTKDAIVTVVAKPAQAYARPVPW